MVEKDPKSLEKCILKEYRAFGDKLGLNEWLLKRFSSAELGANVHATMLEDVDEQSVQQALEEMAEIMSSAQTEPPPDVRKNDSNGN